MTNILYTQDKPTYYYIYKITKIDTGEYYIGQRTSHRPINEDSYMGSGTRLRASIAKHGIDKFQKVILQTCQDRQSLDVVEQIWIGDTWQTDQLCLNLKPGGQFDSGIIQETAKVKMLATKQERGTNKLSDETKHKISEALKGHKHSAETLEKLRQTSTGRKHSAEAIAKRVAKTIGRKNTAETKAKMHIAALGNTYAKGNHVSDAHKAAISNANKGKVMSDAFRKMRSDIVKGRKWWTDGISNKQCHECPGENWYRGKTKTWAKINVAS